jgi:hypothetical protein
MIFGFILICLGVQNTLYDVYMYTKIRDWDTCFKDQLNEEDINNNIVKRIEACPYGNTQLPKFISIWGCSTLLFNLAVIFLKKKVDYIARYSQS